MNDPKPAIPGSPPAHTPHGAELGAPAALSTALARSPRLPWFLLGALGLTLAGLTVFTLASRARARAELDRETTDSLVPVVSTVHPTRGASLLEIELPGDITAYEETPIYSRVSGYLKKWHTDIGTRVAEGQLLAEIETPELDQELIQAGEVLAQAQANLEIARTTAERWKNLRQSDAVSQQDTDVRVATWRARDADLRAAEAAVQRLRETTNFKKLVAPFAGTITARTVDAGWLITAGSSKEIFRLARTDPLRVYVSLPQAYSQMIRSNDEATLTLSEMPGVTFTGRVDRTSGAIDPASRTLLTQVLVTNHEARLLPGAHAMVRLRMAGETTPVVVPVNTLLFRDEKGVQVAVVDPNGAVRLAAVMIGRDFGNTVEIVHGLADTDDIILNPSDSLVSGAKVRVVQPSAPKAKASP